MFSGRLNNDPYDDLLHISDLGEVWVSLNDTESGFDIPFFTGTETTYNPLGGNFTLAGDVDGDELIDIVTLAPDGNVFARLAENNQGNDPHNASVEFGNPMLLAETDLEPLPITPENLGDRKWYFLEDMNNDDIADLVEINNLNGDGAFTVINFNHWSPSRVLVDQFLTGFRHDPANSFQVLLEDVTGDGFRDYIQVAFGEVWVVRSENSGESFSAPVKWETTGYRGTSIETPDLMDHWWVYIEQTDTPGTTILYQLNQIGEIWRVGMTYDPQNQTGLVSQPEKLISTGFRHEEFSDWKVFLGNYNVREDE